MKELAEHIQIASLVSQSVIQEPMNAFVLRNCKEHAVQYQEQKLTIQNKEEKCLQLK